MSLFEKFRRKFAAKPVRRASFRPQVVGLEERWCPATYFQWKAAAAGNWSSIGNWNQSNDGVHWGGANRPPNQATDLVQFDNTSTKTCTLDMNAQIALLSISVGSTGADQIVLSNSGGQNPTYFTLEAVLNWTADDVQIFFSGTANTLISDGGGNLKAFLFKGAKGTFLLPNTNRGTTTWDTSAVSSTTAQISIASGSTLDVKSTGTLTSTYATPGSPAADVLVQRGGTLHFDEGAGVSVGDLFDNNNDGAGYINNAGTVDTEPHGFTVKNKMPIRNVGSMVIDSVTLGFLRAVAGKDYTYGVSVYMPLVGFPDPTPAITLKSPGTLLCDLGYRQDGGALQVGGLSGSVNLQSNLTGDSSVLLNSGTISFPSGTAYVALNFVLPDATSSVQFGSNGDFGMAVTMKVDPTNTQVGVWIGDTVTTNGRYLFAAGNRSSLTINQSVAGTVQPGSWDLFTSGTAKSGDWPAGSITNNLAGTTTQWDTPNNKKFSVKK